MDFNTVMDILYLMVILFFVVGTYALVAVLLMTFGVVFFYILVSFIRKAH